MKKLCFILSIVFITSALVFAVPKVGFQDKKTSKTTIIEALKMNDDSCVTIQGSIIKQISDDKYIFKDLTGTMTVEIDSKNGQDNPLIQPTYWN